MDATTLMRELTASCGLQAVVLDFDCTITREHTGGAQSSSELAPQLILSNVYDPQHFRDFVGTALQLGVELYVATFADRWSGEVGGSDLVLRYMDTVLGKDRPCLKEDDIAAWYKEGLRHKQGHLQWLQTKHRLVPQQTLLIDDDPGGGILPVAARDGYLTAKALRGLRHVQAFTYCG